MSNKDMMEELEEDNVVVEFTDDEGRTFYYQQEMVLSVEGADYALLVGLNIENDEDFDEEEHVIIAKIVKDENGEDEYVDPTDEEFEAVQKAYNEICDAEEASEK